MKLFFAYLRSKWLLLATCAVCVLLFAVAFVLYQIPLGAVLYPAALCLLLGIAVLTADFCRVRRRHILLSGLKAQAEAAAAALPAPDSVTEQDYQTLVAAMQKHTDAIRSADNTKYRDMVDYYTVWAHQIKTPIAAMKLQLQGEDSALSRRLSADLFRIEQYVEMVLAFLRLDECSSDYVFREYALDDVIRKSVRKFAPEFISRKLRLDYAPVDYTVVTDEKWLAFVLEQLLSNALKYTREGGIRIAMDEPGVLCISDTGIGIAAEDLPRIFEKGYTGFNGRTDPAASGIGLYLCRRICKNLGIGISAASEVDTGTVIRLELARYPLRTE